MKSWLRPCVTITWQRIFKGSLQVTIINAFFRMWLSTSDSNGLRECAGVQTGGPHFQFALFEGGPIFSLRAFKNLWDFFMILFLL